MLSQLHIKNVALITEADISFQKGLNVLSGETGAGKSILIDSILFLLGAKPNKDFIRNGAQTASVDGLIKVVNPQNSIAASALGIEPDGDGIIFISRTLNEQGRSVCRINGRVVSAGILREVSSLLVDIHGQHEHQSLLNPAMHIKLLDQFCDIESDKSELAESLNGYREIIRSIKTLEGGAHNYADRKEILQYQVDEISDAGIKPGEEETLSKRKAILSSIERLSKNSRKTLDCLKGDEDSASALIAAGIGFLKEIEASDARLAVMTGQLTEIQDLLTDVIKELYAYTESLNNDPNTLEEIEERLDLIYRLKRKYGGSVAEILAHQQRIKMELDKLSNVEQDLKRLNTEKKKKAAEMLAISEKISQKRKNRAIHIQREIESALKFLGMQHARFEVLIVRKNEFTAEGFDKVEFMISPNLGEPLKSLAKTASGGEMSRVMLSIKSVIADADAIETFIFDEIDSGVSGRTAQQVAEKLRVISKKQQVLCITHLPQIAAMADNHYLIEKKFLDNKTQTYIHELERDQQIMELARLIGGAQITEATLKAAEEMKDMAE